MAEHGPLLGKGNAAEVFAFGQNVLKLYALGTPAAVPLAEAAVTALAAESGLPVPQVLGVRLHEGRWGIEMERVSGAPLADQVEARPELIGAAIAAMVRLQLAMHACSEVRLPSLKARLRAKIGRAPGLAEARRAELIEDLAALPDGAQICHGDFHPFNLLGNIEQPTIIDWADATSGPPAADACRSYLILKPIAPDLAEAYLAGYAAASGTGREAILAWQPCLAAARLSEGLEQQTEFLLALVHS